MASGVEGDTCCERLAKMSEGCLVTLEEEDATESNTD